MFAVGTVFAGSLSQDVDDQDDRGVPDLVIFREINVGRGERLCSQTSG